jgi:hypothetical protein
MIPRVKRMCRHGSKTLGLVGPATALSVRTFATDRKRRYARSVTLKVTWRRALALRMRKHLLDPVGTIGVPGVVRRLCGVQSHVSSSAELLPGFDQYVLGPGTADVHVILAGRRRAVSKQSGWIAPVVVAGGVVTGTWELDGEQVRIAWFEEAGRPPRKALREEVDRLGAILDREMREEITLV